MLEPSSEPFEIADEISNHYSYSYGGISPFFRELRDNARLLATRCTGCGITLCPPRTRCAGCHGTADWIELSGEGTVVSVVDCYYVPANYELHRYLELPYVLALVRLDETDSALYSVVETESQALRSVRPGDRVEARFRDNRTGRLTDVYFVLAEQHERSSEER